MRSTAEIVCGIIRVLPSNSSVFILLSFFRYISSSLILTISIVFILGLYKEINRLDVKIERLVYIHFNWKLVDMKMREKEQRDVLLAKEASKAQGL